MEPVILFLLFHTSTRNDDSSNPVGSSDDNDMCPAQQTSGVDGMVEPRNGVIQIRMLMRRFSRETSVRPWSPGIKF